MEQFINDVVERLSHRLPAEELFTVREVLLFIANDYDITPRTTDLAVVQDGLPKEAKEYLVTKKIEGMSDATLMQYRYALERFFEKVKKPVVQIRTEDLRIYLYQAKESSKMSDRALENHRVYICCFFRWLFANGYLIKDPCINIKPIKYEKKIREPLTDTEMEYLRHACTTYREKAVVEVLYSTGCRVSELIKIRVCDIDFDKREVQLYGKGKKHRIAYLNARAILNIRLLLGNRGYDSEYIFTSEKAPHDALTSRSIDNMVKRLGEKAQIKGRVFPHRVRHTTATDALRKGMPIEQVQQLLGHERVETTLEYAKVNRNEVKERHAKYIV